MRIARSVPPRRLVRTSATLSVVLLASLFASGAAPAEGGCTSPPAVYPVSALAPGMTATGLTTLTGDTPTAFTVEILGVIPDGFLLGMDAIIGRITGPASFLDQAGGFFGMSGSPVTIGGKLVGAISMGFWSDPTVVGITPASAMVDLLGVSTPGSIVPTRAIAFTPETRRAVARALGVPSTQVTGGLEPLPVPLGVSGLSGRRLHQLQARLDRRGAGVRLFASGSAGSPAIITSTPFAPGQPIGSVISFGDATIWAMGTTSIVCGDRVVAFGHSLFGNAPGEISLGMTGVDVLTVLHTPGSPGEMLGVITDTRGTFSQDRFAGQAGTIGALPPTAAITSELSSPDTGVTRNGRTDVAFQEDYWLPEVVWGHLYGNLAAVFQRFGPGTSGLSWTIHGTTGSGTPFTVENRGMFWSDYDAAVTVSKVYSTLYQLTNNRFTDVTIGGVDVHGSITGQRLEGRIGRIRTSTALQPSLRSRNVVRVRPGGKVTVEVTFTPMEGPGTLHRTTFAFRVPRGVHGLHAVQLRGGKDRPWMDDQGAGSFDDLVRVLSGGDHRNDLVVTGPFGRSSFEQDVIVSGRGSFTVRLGR